jgi:hypothetical protein
MHPSLALEIWTHVLERFIRLIINEEVQGQPFFNTIRKVCVNFLAQKEHENFHRLLKTKQVSYSN